MNQLDEDYKGLLGSCLYNGIEKTDRTGTGTLSVFGRQIKHRMKDGFPLLTTKKMPFKTMVTELLWFLRGDTNIKYLVDNNCHIWDGDCYKFYLNNCTENYKNHNKNVVETDIPDHWKDSVKLDLSELLSEEEFINKIKTDDEFAKTWGNLGKIYGFQWRNWGGWTDTKQTGFLHKTDNGWSVKWSDLHSFANGTEWLTTPIQDSDQSLYGDEDEGRKVYYKNITLGYDKKSFCPIQVAKVINDKFDKYVGGIDQIQNLINDLKTNPDSRRLMVNAWNVGELDQMVLPPCFSEDMMVACVDGYRKISEITINDSVLTEDGSYQKVYELHETDYIGEILNIKVFGNSKIIEVTPNHPFLIKDKGYVTASEITEDDYLAIPINKKEIVPSFDVLLKDNQYSEKLITTILDNEDYWFLMGYFLGDGWLIDSKKEIYFTINDKQVDNILPILQNVIGLAKLNNSGVNCKKYVGKKKQVFEILSKFGKYANGKFIPQFVHDAPKHLIKRFIDGYRMADGCETNDGISFTTVSENIAFGLQLLYAKLDIKASVYFQERPKKTIIEGREVNQKNTFSVNVYKQKNKSSKYIFDENYLWLKVKGVVSTNTHRFVYNISTENNHTYNVFNLVNHNCHYGFQVYTRELSMEERHKLALPIWKEKYGPLADMMVPTNIDNTPYKIPTRAISLMWNQRSVDTFLGLPFNIASYGLLLEIIAKEVNMVPEELIGNLGDVHLYSNHIEQAKEQIGREFTEEEIIEHLQQSGMDALKNEPRMEYISKLPKRTREPFPLPTIKVSGSWKFLSSSPCFGDTIQHKDIELENYQSHPTIKAPLSN